MNLSEEENIWSLFTNIVKDVAEKLKLMGISGYIFLEPNMTFATGGTLLTTRNHPVEWISLMRN